MLIDQIKFEEILKSKGFSATKTRKSVYQSLAGHNRPISINTLITALSDKVDRSSVYRNIELFEKIGIVKKVYSGWKYRLELGEEFKPHHHHLTCNNCGKIIPINLGQNFEKSLNKLGEKHNFKITDHLLELSGYCSKCQLKT